MIGQAPPAMQQMMDSAEMQQVMASPEGQQQIEQMMRSPEMQQMMSDAGPGSAGMNAMMGTDSPSAQRMGGR